ncbi:hypothetical protein GP486_006809 [Trichoglossum hirsutum]|uniref:Protein kinase domain-containing protein n=1 Tax=Trichoglossum hirsutum TaxID=265104 RepID=A0A9P8IGN2_9PEZI|nr:hypothetical protein GP486_006809 [Trichoglossum hirsutum]
MSVNIVLAVQQLCGAAVAAYNLYLDVRDFPSSYLQLRLGLVIERQRLQLWAREIISQEQPPQDEALWRLFKLILARILGTLEGSTRTMEEYELDAGFPEMAGLSGDLEGAITELRVLERLSSPSASQPPPPRRTVSNILRSVKFIVKDKSKLEQMVKDLCYLNDSLDKLVSHLQRDSARRKLRAFLSTNSAEQLLLLQHAAAMLNHHDIEKLASSMRILGESSHDDNDQPDSKPESEEPGSQNMLLDYRVKRDHLTLEKPFQADQTRTRAVFRDRDGREEEVLVDWRCARDETWRRKNPVAFKRRTDNLAKILNQDLAPLRLAVLHCVGYYNQNSTVTGYLFRPPPESTPGEDPITLFDLLTSANRASDVPDLGERFALASALVTTVFEFHNMGWLHKNLQSKNILFWPRDAQKPPRPNLRKPYLLGFDTSRPNQPGEVSEKPLSTPEDDLYRHPHYKSPDPRPFRSPYDIYSLGVLLFEIGMWRIVSYQHRGSRASSSRAPPPVSLTDPQFIQKVVMGPAADLGRYMGASYRDAVLACLNLEFDRIWDASEEEEEEEEEGERDRMLRFQAEVQSRIVDPIALCRA